MTRVASDLFDSVAAEGARQSRSAKQQLDHWARVGREVTMHQSAARRRIAAVLAGDEPMAGLTSDERLVLNAEIDAEIDLRMGTTIAELVRSRDVVTRRDRTVAASRPRDLPAPATVSLYPSHAERKREPMRSTRWTIAVTGIAAVALTLAACGSKASPSDNNTGSNTGSSTGTTSSSASTSSYKACMVTDTGGINDKSFNQSAYQGLTEAQSAGAATVSYLPSTQTSDYAKNIAAQQGEGCKMIVTVGYLMADATDAAAKTSSSQHFAIVDNTGNGTNVEGLLFNTAQAGFMGGYLAAGYSKSGKVATYGGEDFPTVTVYMDGFWEGVQYYNQQNHKSVQVLGWNEKTQKGSFAGSFTDQTKGSQLAKNFMQAGADVIYPVAGGTGLGSAAAVKAAHNGTVVIWVDTDGCVSAPQYCSVFLTTTFKGIQSAVKTAVVNGSKGDYTGTNYVGTLANGGTGLSPYHDFASKVTPALQAQVKKVGQEIESGKIKIKSKNQPK